MDPIVWLILAGAALAAFLLLLLAAVAPDPTPRDALRPWDHERYSGRTWTSPKDPSYGERPELVNGIYTLVDHLPTPPATVGDGYARDVAERDEEHDATCYLPGAHLDPTMSPTIERAREGDR